MQLAGSAIFSDDFCHPVPLPTHCHARFSSRMSFLTTRVLGWRLSRLADYLRENKLAAVGILPKRYADFDRAKPFVASINITPIAKQ